jgi:hypothetical protein
MTENKLLKNLFSPKLKENNFRTKLSVLSQTKKIPIDKTKQLFF